MSSRPVFFALYLMGAEVFAVKWGAVDDEPAPKPLEGGGSTGSHEVGFVMEQTPVVVRGERQ